MQAEIYEYDGFVKVPGLDTTARSRIKDLVREFGYNLDVYDEHVELIYSGRDQNRRFVDFMKAFASIVGSAEGEVTCEWEMEGQSRYEIFTVKDGSLFVQEAQLIKGKRKLVL